MSKRKSFLIHIDSLDILDDLSDEQAGQLFKAIKSHQQGQDVELSPIVKIAFSPFKNQFARDDEKYEKLCEKNRLIAEKRYATKSTTGKTGNQAKPSVTKSTDNKNDSDSDSDSDLIKTMSTKADTVVEIFDYWKMVMQKKANTTLSEKRKTKIKQRLKDGYTVEEIKQAIFNCSNTPHNMGNNERGQRYDDIELIC